MTNYLLAMAVFAAFYALMALGLNVIWGFAGMVNLGLVGFFAIGSVRGRTEPRIHCDKRNEQNDGKYIIELFH